MPRKKKAKVTNSRPKAKLPDGDEGKDLETDLKQAKLETLLKDFDDTVEQKCMEITNQGKSMIREIKTCFKVELMKIPKPIAEMKLSEFLELGGTVNKVKQAENQQIEEEMRLPKKGGRGGALEAIAEEGNNENVCPAEAVKTRTRRTRAGNRILATAKRVTRSSLNDSVSTAKTPFTKKMATGWETPLVTPKFDPRLPFTPATQGRKKKPGEFTVPVQMSLAGSPINTDNLDVNIPIKFKSGSVFCLGSESDPSQLPLGELENDTLKELSKLQENIAKIMMHHKTNKR